MLPDSQERAQGIIVGLLLAHGSFGGDGRQPQVTLRMHVRHERLLRWLQQQVPGSRLYGPYDHGGRQYFQWVARGRVLVASLLPLLDESITAELDSYAFERLAAMKDRYAGPIAHAQKLSQLSG